MLDQVDSGPIAPQGVERLDQWEYPGAVNMSWKWVALRCGVAFASVLLLRLDRHELVYHLLGSFVSSLYSRQGNETTNMHIIVRCRRAELDRG